MEKAMCVEVESLLSQLTQLLVGISIMQVRLVGLHALIGMGEARRGGVKCTRRWM